MATDRRAGDSAPACNFCVISATYPHPRAILGACPRVYRKNRQCLVFAARMFLALRINGRRQIIMRYELAMNMESLPKALAGRSVLPPEQLKVRRPRWVSSTEPKTGALLFLISANRRRPAASNGPDTKIMAVTE